jgi:AbiV family abortive infection protein
MKSHLRSYSGPLGPPQIAEGIAAAQSNARRLIEDAKVLLEAGRFPSASALAILAMEERGKVQILKRLALVSEPAEVKLVWREYRSHRAKNAGWIIPTLVGQGARTMHALSDAVDADGEHAGLLDALKQISFYTDCLGDGHWSVPDEVVDEEVARSMIASATAMWGANEVTVREVELWGEIVGPFYNRPGMIEAVLRWQASMIEEGLSDTSLAALEAFMRGQPIEVEAATESSRQS